MDTLLIRLAVSALIIVTSNKALAQEAIRLRRQDQREVFASSYPPKLSSCRGVAVISHGAGGSEQGYRYLGEALSGLGYHAVVVGHPESGGRALFKHLRGNGLSDGLAKLTTDSSAYRGRLMDIAAAKEWARGWCRAPESLLIGHSMGAATVMMESGAHNNLGIHGEDSFDAYIALSPQGVGAIFPEHAWSSIKKPVLLITGTRDNELGKKSWKTRLEPFHDMPPGCKWLAVIDGASHMNLAGRGFSRHVEGLSIQTIEHFLTALRRGDCRPPPAAKGLELSTK
jgi:predicted dienelactone hydrolase